MPKGLPQYAERTTRKYPEGSSVSTQSSDGSLSPGPPLDRLVTVPSCAFADLLTDVAFRFAAHRKDACLGHG